MLKRISRRQTEAKLRFAFRDLWVIPPGKTVMGRAILAAVVLCFSLSLTATQNSKPAETIPVSQIHAGMRGVAYTVFQGTKPEAMEVEVLGVLKNANGPKGDVILIRLGGEKAEYNGVVAGMSGSPVYLNGKLAGAVAFRIGEFSKEPIAGVTPITEMLEINALDRSPAVPSAVEAKAAAHLSSKTASPAPISRTPSTRNPTKPTSGGATRQCEIQNGTNTTKVPGATTRNRTDPTTAAARFMHIRLADKKRVVTLFSNLGRHVSNRGVTSGPSGRSP